MSDTIINLTISTEQNNDVLLSVVPDNEPVILTIDMGGVGPKGDKGDKGEDGTGSVTVDTTYTELRSLYDSSTLVVGNKYRFTFNNIHNIHGTTEETTGADEVLVVTAIGTQQLDIVAISETYPQDIVYYNINHVLPNDNGTILYREDTVQRISAYYDWRTTLHRRWITDDPLLNPSPPTCPDPYFDATPNTNLYDDFLTFNCPLNLVLDVSMGTASHDVVFLEPSAVWDMRIEEDVAACTIGAEQVVRIKHSNGEIKAGFQTGHLNIGTCVDGVVITHGLREIIVEDGASERRITEGYRAYRLPDDRVTEEEALVLIEDNATPYGHRHFPTEVGAQRELTAGVVSRPSRHDYVGFDRYYLSSDFYQFTQEDSPPVGGVDFYLVPSINKLVGCYKFDAPCNDAYAYHYVPLDKVYNCIEFANAGESPITHPSKFVEVTTYVRPSTAIIVSDWSTWNPNNAYGEGQECKLGQKVYKAIQFTPESTPVTDTDYFYELPNIELYDGEQHPDGQLFICITDGVWSDIRNHPLLFNDAMNERYFHNTYKLTNKSYDYTAFNHNVRFMVVELNPTIGSDGKSVASVGNNDSILSNVVYVLGYPNVWGSDITYTSTYAVRGFENPPNYLTSFAYSMQTDGTMNTWTFNSVSNEYGLKVPDIAGLSNDINGIVSKRPYMKNAKDFYRYGAYSSIDGACYVPDAWWDNFRELLGRKWDEMAGFSGFPALEPDDCDHLHKHNQYITGSEALTRFADANHEHEPQEVVITKEDVENVLTGEITSHTHHSFSGNYDDLTNIPEEFNPKFHTHNYLEELPEEALTIDDIGVIVEEHDPAIQTHLYNTDNPHSTTSLQTGADWLHGVETKGTMTWDDGTMELVVTGITYWFQGVKVTCNADNIIADSGITGQHYFYFDDVSGTLRESTSVWTLADKVPIASVFWNGTIGAVIDERHGYRRDLEWHTWAHLAVGTRYISGYAHDAQLVPFIMYEGSIRDEDLLYNAANDSTVTGFRIFHQVAGGGWTFVNNTVPWGTTANVQFIDIDGTPSYVPSDVPNSSYINVWIYAAPDISVPYYCALETAVQSYNTVALARAANPPTLSGSGITPELKLLYRLIVRGNESISEVTDYRNASSIPSGGTSSISAAAVQYDNTTSGLTATNAQTAIDETKALIPSIIGLLDTTAHAAIDHTGITGVGGGSGTSVGLTITLGSNTFF